jgi:hypothetical protein
MGKITSIFDRQANAGQTNAGDSAGDSADDRRQRQKTTTKDNKRRKRLE